MGSGKTEDVIEKSVARQSKADEEYVDNCRGDHGLPGGANGEPLRLQKDMDKDEVHCHEGDLCFRFKGIRRFQSYFQDFVKIAPALCPIAISRTYPTRVAFEGLKDDPGKKRVACDLHFVLFGPKWEMQLVVPGASTERPPDVVMNDPLLEKLKDIIIEKW
jgi:hypothetical protein